MTRDDRPTNGDSLRSDEGRSVVHRVNWSYPQILLAGLALALIFTVGIAGTTSQQAFGAYNPAWDGSAQLRDVGSEAGAEPVIARNVTQYGAIEANGTVAVVFSPEETYTKSEVAAIRQFVRAGGTLVVAEDFGTRGTELTAGVGATARPLGQPLRDEQRHGPGPAFPVTTAVGNHSYATNISAVLLNHGTALQPGNGTVLLRTSSFAYIDRNHNEQLDDDESLQAYPVATVEQVGRGEVVVIGDPSAFVNAMLAEKDNRRFLSGIISPHDRLLIDVSHAGAVPPLAAAQLTLQKSAVVQLIVGTAAVLVAGLLAIPLGLRSKLRRLSTASVQRVTLSRAEVAESLEARHPDWDRERIERVTTALFDRRNREASKEDDGDQKH